MSRTTTEKLCDRWGSSSPEFAITTAIASVFPDLNKIRPPVDLRLLAKRRGIIQISTTDIKIDGSISLVGTNRFSVQLNRTHPETRRRFTLAHEIGHTFFFELEDESTLRSRARIEDSDLNKLPSNRKEEVLCNIVACELLMPYKHFTDRFRSVGPSSNTILFLAQLFRSSLWATARRLTEVSPFRLLIALWEYYPAPQRYETSWIVSSGNSGAMKRLTVEGSAPLFKSFESSRVFRGRKWVSLGGPVDDYFVDGIVLRASNPRRVLTTFVLEQFAEKLVRSPVKPVETRNQLQLFDVD